MKKIIKEWTLDEARASLPQIFNQAIQQGPQRVLVGSERAVIISEEEYRKLACSGRGFIHYLITGPSFRWTRAKTRYVSHAGYQVLRSSFFC